MTQARFAKAKVFSGKAARGLAAAFVLLATAATPALAGTSRGWEHGGKFVNFDPVIQAYNRSGATFRITGLCQSACTTFLSIKNVCVERSANFEFHAGSDGEGNISISATRYMQSTYNERLRRFVIDNRYMEDFSFHRITGNDIIDKFGYRACNEQDRLLEAQDSDIPGANHGTFAENTRNLEQPSTRGIEGSYHSR
ncbi:MAG: hypothetical protein AB7O46_12925 [Xanthobacteraceae bacterium]